MLIIILWKYYLSYTVPSPSVVVSVPSGTKYAGTFLTMTCTITVDDGVTTDVEVDVTWTPASGQLSVQPTTGSKPVFSSIATVSPLSINDTEFTCSAVVRPPLRSRFINESKSVFNTGGVSVQGKS